MEFIYKYPGILRHLKTEVKTKSNDIEQRVEALWDTGATGSCISQELITQLQLQPIGITQIRTPSGKLLTNTYILDLSLNDKVKFEGLKVIGSQIGRQGFDVLIGMDIISKGDFAISNFENQTRFLFRYPSEKHIEGGE